MAGNGYRVLVQYCCNFADEFDVHGFEVVDESWWKDHQKHVEEEVHFPREEYFGTNEYVTYSNADGYFQCFKVDLISPEEEATLKKFFPYESFGKINYIED